MSRLTVIAEEALEQGLLDEAVHQAEQAARAGDVDAIALLATWRLIGHPLPRDLSLARQLLAQASAGQHQWAALAHVALTANGSGFDRDWAEAMNLLRGYSLWSDEAAAHLHLLESMDLAEDGSPRQLPKAQIFSRTPHALVFKSFLSAEECAHVARAGQDILAPSTIFDPVSGRQKPHPIRTSSGASIGPTRESLPLQAIQRRIAAVTGIPLAHGEPFSLLHYAPGQEYRLHLDSLPPPCNQRIATMIIYLNQGYIGGETYFEHSQKCFSAEIGDALFFHNTTPEGLPEICSRHAGLPVRSGVKWIATRWLREAPFDPWVSGR